MNKSVVSVNKLKLQKEFLENEINLIKRKFKILESENILFSVYFSKQILYNKGKYCRKVVS